MIPPPLPTVLDQAQHKYFQAEIKTLAGADTTYTVLDPYLMNDSVDRRLIPISGYARNAELIDGRKLGTSPGDIPFLDETTGKLDQSLLSIQNWLAPVADGTALSGISTPSTGDRAYVISESEVYTWNGSSWVADSAEVLSQIGDRIYTQDNFVTDGQTLTQSLDALDTNLQTTLSGIGDRTYTADNYVTDGETITASVDALDQQVKTNADNITTNQTNITNNTNALSTANTNLGSLTYTEDNFVTDNEPLTSSVDVLDIQVKNHDDAILINQAGISGDFDTFILP
ncbi:MAG TPA: hypothetical protein VIT68_03425 [Candidatus Gracilibacteria bacterium]